MGREGWQHADKHAGSDTHGPARGRKRGGGGNEGALALAAGSLGAQRAAEAARGLRTRWQRWSARACVRNRDSRLADARLHKATP